MRFMFLYRRLRPHRSPSGCSRDIGQIWRFPGARSSLKAVIFSLSLGSCAAGVSPDLSPAGNPGFAGVVAAPEPRAAAMGRDVILSGGNAADAAATIGLALVVTLSSRAGLHAPGQCLVVDPTRERSEVMDFSAVADGAELTTFRGLAALQARYGKQNWATTVASVENLARFGFPVAKQLSIDLDKNSSGLLQDAMALRQFLSPRRTYVAAGETLTLPNLAARLADLRNNGVDAAPSGLQWRNTSLVADGSYVLHQSAFLANAAVGLPVDGTGFVVGDRSGMAVSCVFSMGAPFGSGRLDVHGAALKPATPHGNFAVMIASDATFGQVVLATAVAGSATPEALGVIQTSWMKERMPPANVRSRLQRLTNQTGLSALKCDTGLGVLGRDCLTISDIDGFGIGETFARE
jgi:hypothetical protein